MFKSLAFYIGSRYTRAKKRSGFISFISFASMLGIALGVLVLITALSVMNGFDYEIKTRFFALMPQISVLTGGSVQNSWQDLAKKIDAIPQVTGVAPFASGKGILMKNGQVYGVDTVGIIPSEEGKVSKLPQKMVAGTLKSLTPNSFNVVIGQTLANNLDVGIGDKITLFTPQTSVSLVGVFPRYRRFTVSGIFHASDAFGFDLAYAFINMQDAERVFPPGKGTSGLHVTLDDMYQVGGVTQRIQQLLPPGYVVTNWTRSNGAFFQAIYMEKTILFVILILIIAVAAFNLVATLVMVVNDKRADIAILRTLGASPGTILRTFIVQGFIVGVFGTLLGLIGGLLLASYATAIVNWYQHTFHVQLLQSSVLFVDFLPSRIEASDVISVSIIAIVLSLIASLYPAWLAFRTQPAEALRYE
ncbi:MAG: lipoprotein-releasing system transmembrane subunit LolC [Coxiella sp. (in: Bacteria)]|nr:MAG: lipoprotein-releasing system transmembrane subunit LolC [Coxiella sp. (in: g-proteobacteria)]